MRVDTARTLGGRGIGRLVLVTAALLLPGGMAAAQSLTGALIGTVLDEQGGVLTGARVTIASPALIGGAQAVLTSDQGQHRFPSLPPGRYTVDVELLGFTPYHHNELLIGAGSTLERTVVLKILTASFGGPVVRERLWFFAGYQYLRDYDSQPGTDPARPRRYEQNKAFGKLTWRLTPRTRLEQSLHHELGFNTDRPTIVTPFEAVPRRHIAVPAITFGYLTQTLSPNTGVGRARGAIRLHAGR